ncbi:MAG: hypothetical protein ACK4FS_09475 [Flavobacterium sp.]
MKPFKFLTLIACVALMSSCSSTSVFPVSSTVPAAEIKVKKTQDKNKNNVIELTAKNLADASRLNPPKNNYSVWIVTEDNMVKNIGQLTNRNARTATLKTSTPFEVIEIFITAEDRGNATYPSGVEISRTKFNK